MAATVTSKLIVSLTSILQNSIGLASAQATIETGVNKALATGTGADQCDRVYSENDKSISAAYDLDLSGSLLDAFGAAAVFAKVRAVLVVADPANSGDVVIGGDAAAFLMGFGAVGHTFAVKPGGVFLAYAPAAAGYAVVAATGDILQFAPSAGTQVFDFAILGTSV
jgi:hypothetical protein